MRTLLLFFFAVLLALLTIPRVTAAQDGVTPDTVHTKRGTVEFIGLDRWSLDQLTDSLKAIAPDRSLHFCAATLKDPLGFADAGVIRYFGSEELYTVITAVEPGDSNRVQYREPPSDTLQLPDDWAFPLNLAKEQPRTFDAVFQLYDEVLKGGADSARALAEERKSIDAESAGQLWSWLREHDTSETKRRAVRHLTEDADSLHRKIAAAALVNFADDDRVWHALADALRDADNRVRFAAQITLGTMLRAGDVPPVDWQPATESLRYLLDGTNAFAYRLVLWMLAETRVDPALQEELLSGGGTLVLGYYGSDYDHVQTVADRFLQQISGRRHESLQQWQQWIDNLPAE